MKLRPGRSAHSQAEASPYERRKPGARESLPQAPYSSIGTQAQNRLRSPYTSSMRFTLGQNLLSRTQGSGNTASSRE